MKNAEAILTFFEEVVGWYCRARHNYMVERVGCCASCEEIAWAEDEHATQAECRSWRARLDVLLADDRPAPHPYDDLLTWLKKLVADGRADYVLRNYRGMRCAPEVMAYVQSLELPKGEI